MTNLTCDSHRIPIWSQSCKQCQRLTIFADKEKLQSLNYKGLRQWANERDITSSEELKLFAARLDDINVDYDVLYQEERLARRRAQCSANQLTHKTNTLFKSYCPVLEAVLNFTSETIENRPYFDWFALKELVGSCCGCEVCGASLQQLVETLPKREHDGWLFTAADGFLLRVCSMILYLSCQPEVKLFLAQDLVMYNKFLNDLNYMKAQTQTFVSKDNESEIPF